ncbi:hypothetical protein EDD85DRAFT_956438 [Armillaria nabsnona]|nr:hypothetical protein EDD85DRAFT_956438 [Armillaria nabsnona]
MAKPTDPQELAKVKAQDMYNSTAIAIEDLLDDFPNPTWDSTRTDTWLIDIVSHWSTCEDNWSPAGVVSKEWYKLEYSVLVRVPDLPMDLVTFARTEFNELVKQALDYNLDIVLLPVCRAQAKCSKAPVLPSHLCQDATVTHSRVTTPAPLPPASKPTTPVPSTSNSGVSTEQVAQLPADKVTGAQQHTAQWKVKPMPITAGSGDIVFPPDPTLPLHQKSGRNFKVGPPIHAARLTPSVQLSSSQLLTVDAATCASIAPGPNPIQEGSVVLLFGMPQPLFLLGTDDEEEHVQEDSVREEQAEDTAGTDGEDDNMGGPDDEEDSPPPTKKARRLRQGPKISFVFDETTGDFVDSYPTIFLPRPVVPLFQGPDAAYLQLTKGTKSDVSKKRKKDAKGKDKKAETTVSCKQSRNDDDGAPSAEKPAFKRLKSNDHKIADNKVVRAVPAIHTCGPSPSKPPAVTLGVGGGGFSEKVPSSAKVIKNSLMSIGVLEVEEDFGDFVKVDGRYWNKEVAPFVGERYTAPCNHCKHLETLNVFEGALDTLAQHADSIEDIVVNYMAGLNALAQLNGLRVQAGHLRECATFDESDANEDDNNEAPDDVTEGVAGPSKKRKGKSG